ncbi:MAG: glycosyltransferase family 39 protein, partial [Tepidisphaerales bacterium]
MQISNRSGHIIAGPGGVLAATLILAVSGRYGIFRDELYYWACARRLAWGYVDHPPLSIFVLHFLGDSLWLLKLPAALAFGLAVFLMARQAITMGAGPWGTAVTTIATALCPLLAGVAGLYSMNVLEIAFWAIATTITTRLLVAPTRSSWISLGAVIGLGVLNKYSMLLFLAGLSVGLLLTPARRQLITPGPWLAGLIAVVIISPHAAWEVNHGLPSLEFMRNATNVKMATISPLDFIEEQIVDTNPAFAICWLLGLGGLLLTRRLAPWRAHGVAFLVSAGVLMASRTARASYLAPSYSLLLPAGGVMLEQLVPSTAVWGRRLVLAVM